MWMHKCIYETVMAAAHMVEFVRQSGKFADKLGTEMVLCRTDVKACFTCDCVYIPLSRPGMVVTEMVVMGSTKQTSKCACMLCL